MLFTIKDAENLCGIKTYTLRMWEKRYGIINPQRSITKIRYYNSSEIKSLLNITLLNNNGYKISHIAKMSEHAIKSKITSFDNNKSGLQRDINNLLIKIIEADFWGFEEELDKCCSKAKAEDTFLQFLLAFLDKAECIWRMKGINAAVKHLVHNAIKQKISAAIDESKIGTNKSSKCYCVFLPEQEFNELGLLAATYLLKSSGMRVIYSGANTNFKEVEFISKSIKPDFFYTHLSKPSVNAKFNKFISEFNKSFRNKTLIISGKIKSSITIHLPSNIQLKNSISELLHT